MKVKHWRTILYQILSVLAIIHTKYPSFHARGASADQAQQGWRRASWAARACVNMCKNVEISFTFGGKVIFH